MKQFNLGAGWEFLLRWPTTWREATAFGVGFAHEPSPHGEYDSVLAFVVFGFGFSLAR